MSSGKGREKIKLMGASTDVRARNVGGSPDSRRDVSDMASLAGFKGTAGTDGIGTVSMGAYTSAIAKLEREYGALKAIPTVLAGADGAGFYAAAAGSASGAVLMLNRKSMANAAKHAKAQKSEEADGFKMPTDGKLTSLAGYTVRHEYTSTGICSRTHSIKRLGRTGILGLRPSMQRSSTAGSRRRQGRSTRLPRSLCRSTGTPTQRRLSPNPLQTSILVPPTRSVKPSVTP